MSSRILLRLIDEAIIPALIVFVAKAFSVLFLIQFAGVSWRLDSNTVIPRLLIENPETLTFVNTYSNLVMLGAVVVGLIWMLVRAYHFHETHIHPNFVLRLLSMNLTALIVSSEDVYHKATVWLTLLWLTTMMIGFQTFLNVSQPWLLICAIIVSLCSTWFVVADIEREMEPLRT